ncbi:MFS transporter [Streptomyces sp. NPDC005438]|uniref:MFS transporter n=1 Tax=Streptomyces sp. NPDC005438 TaxID=3156880 RepID=UPI0033A2678B
MGGATRQVLADRTARLLLGAVLVSGFGSSAMALVAGVWAKSLTGSSSLAALATFCVWAPLLVGPWLGALADRQRRRALLIRVHLALALLLPTLCLVTSGAWTPLLLLVLLVYGCASVLTDSAEAALVAQAVPSALRGHFNGLRLTANEGMKVLAPVVGAQLFVRFGGHAVALLDAATFALATLAFALIRDTEPTPAPERRPWTAQATEGARELWRHPAPRRLVTVAAVTLFLAGVNGAAVYAVIDEGLGRRPEFAGTLYAVQGAGSALSGTLAGPLLRRLPEHLFAGAGTVTFTVGVLLRTTPSVDLALWGSALVGLGLPCALVAALTAVQREVPEPLLGRASATAGSLVFAPNALALGAGAALLGAVGHRPLLWGASALTLLALPFCLHGSVHRGRGVHAGQDGGAHQT